jgi:hypothetical protein
MTSLARLALALAAAVALRTDRDLGFDASEAVEVRRVDRLQERGPLAEEIAVDDAVDLDRPIRPPPPRRRMPLNHVPPPGGHVAPPRGL